MKDKGVVQVEEVFAPIIFFGNTIETQGKVTDMMSDPSTPVSITYSPNMLKQERLIKLLIQNVQVFALKDGIALYAPLYESMDQVNQYIVYKPGKAVACLYLCRLQTALGSVSVIRIYVNQVNDDKY